MFKISRASLAHVLLSAAVTILPIGNASAAPGTLPQAPLFLSTIVEPNIFLTLDDSGSMELVTMVEDGTAGFATWSGLPILPSTADYLGYWHPTWPEDAKFIVDVVPPSTLGDGARRPSRYSAAKAAFSSSITALKEGRA